MNMSTIDVWVLHSPYPDGTWRGDEKCCAAEPDGGPVLFLSRQAALDYIEREGLQENLYVPVQCVLVIPGIRAPFRISNTPLEERIWEEFRARYGYPTLASPAQDGG